MQRIESGIQPRSMDKMVAQFFADVEIDPQASQEAGRPIHRDIVRARIQQVGRRDIVIINADEPYQLPDVGVGASEHLTPAQVFPEEYQAFMRHQVDDHVEGTRIEHAAFVSRAQAADLIAMGLRSVEQLAQLSDERCAQLGREMLYLRDQARRVIDVGSATAADAQKDAMIAQLQARLDALESAARPQPEEVKEAPKPQQREADFFDRMSVDDLRNWLSEQGVAFGSNLGAPALRTKARARARELMAAEAAE